MLASVLLGCLRLLFELPELVSVVSVDIALEVQVVVGMSIDCAEEVADSAKNIVECRQVDLVDCPKRDRASLMSQREVLTIPHKYPYG